MEAGALELLNRAHTLSMLPKLQAALGSTRSGGVGFGAPVPSSISAVRSTVFENSGKSSGKGPRSGSLGN